MKIKVSVLFVIFGLMAAPAYAGGWDGFAQGFAEGASQRLSERSEQRQIETSVTSYYVERFKEKYDELLAAHELEQDKIYNALKDSLYSAKASAIESCGDFTARKTSVKGVSCFNKQLLKACRDNRYPYLDIVDNLANANLIVAKQYASGDITLEQFGRAWEDNLAVLLDANTDKWKNKREAASAHADKVAREYAEQMALDYQRSITQQRTINSLEERVKAAESRAERAEQNSRLNSSNPNTFTTGERWVDNSSDTEARNAELRHQQEMRKKEKEIEALEVERSIYKNGGYSGSAPSAVDVPKPRYIH